ncbi:MAG: hypothetical protein GX862_07600, partial [Leucobacter sp.]|nr:hypothetical protein [Leucobacter sp.]
MLPGSDVSDSGRRYAEREIEDWILASLDSAETAPRRRILLTGDPGNGVGTILTHRLPERLGSRARNVDAGGARAVSQVAACVSAGADVLLVSEAATLHDLRPDQLAQTHVLCVGSLAELPDWFCESQHFEVFEVPPLSPTELPRFLAACLGDETDLVAAADLGRAAGFIPGVLTVVLRELIRTGGLVHTGATWRLATPLTGEVIATHVTYWMLDLDPESTTVLRRLAFEEAAPEHRLPAPAVDALDALGLIHRPHGGYVPVRGPLLAEAIRSLTPAVEAADRYRAALHHDAPTPAAVRWALEHQHPVSAQQVGSVLATLRQQHDWKTSIDLVEFTLPSAPAHARPHLLLELAHAWRFRGSVREADAALIQAANSVSRLPESAAARELRKTIVAARADLAHYGQGDRALAINLLDDALQETEAGDEEGAGVERSRGFLTAQRLLHLAYGGEPIVFLHDYGDDRTKQRLAHVDREDRARVTVASCLALAAIGQPKRGYRRALRLKTETVLHKQLGTWLNEELNATIFVCAISSTGPAHMPAIVRALDPPVTPATPPTENLAFDLARATWFLHTGSLARARSIADHAAAAGKLRDPSGFAAALNALRAHLSALLGDRPGASSLLDAQARIPLSSSASIAGAIQANLAAARLLVKTADAPTQLLMQAQKFIESELYGFAAELLHVGVRFALREPAELLVGIASHLDGALNRTRTRHAAALLEDDPVALLRVASSFQKLGLPLLASEVCAQVLALPNVPERVRRTAQDKGGELCSSLDAPGHHALHLFGRSGV